MVDLPQEDVGDYTPTPKPVAKKKAAKKAVGMQIKDMRWITEISPNGTSRPVLQWLPVGGDDWIDIPKSGIKRKLEWA